MKPLTVLLIALWICTSWVSIDSAASDLAEKPGKSTPMHKGAKIGDIEKAKALLAAGAKVNAINAHGETPLYRAAWEGHTEVLKVLLAAGAKVNAIHDGGLAPLDWADTIEMKAFLRKHGAKTGAELDAEGKQGKRE